MTTGADNQEKAKGLNHQLTMEFVCGTKNRKLLADSDKWRQAPFLLTTARKTLRFLLELLYLESSQVTTSRS